MYKKFENGVYTLVCQNCGKDFEAPGNRRKYCPECEHSFRPCKVCGKKIIPFLSERIFCSAKCAQADIRTRSGYEPYLHSERFKQDMLNKYGVEHPMYSEEIKNNLKQTNLERYGTENPMQNPEVQKRTEQTMKERYGGYTLQSPELIAKYKQTNLELYGVENPGFIESSQEKIKATNRATKGVDWPMQSKDVRDKSRETMIRLYGCEYTSQSTELKRKSILSFKKHFELYDATDEELLHAIDIVLDKNSLNAYILRRIEETKAQDGITYSIDTLSHELYYDPIVMVRILKDYEMLDLLPYHDEDHLNGTSYEEIDVREYLKQYFDVIANDRTHLLQDNGWHMEIDIYIPEYKIGVEFDGTYWHSDEVLLERHGCTAEIYHAYKDSIAEAEGIQLIHVKEKDYLENRDECLGKLLLDIYNIIEKNGGK